MFNKVRQPWRVKNYSWKSVTSIVLFGAIIVVFALFGIGSPDRSGMTSGGGTVAVVNDTGISVAEWRRGVEMNTRNSGYPLDKLPADQRELFEKSIQQQTLNQMILTEVAYQTAAKYGILASDGEVRDMLLSAPAFQDNGRFVRDRYEAILSQIGQSPDDFERGLRRQIVLHRVEDLFSTASMPTTTEVQQLTELNSNQANIRYVELSPVKLQSDKAVSEKDVDAFLKDPTKQEALKNYYTGHTLDYQLAEKVHARDILLRIDDKNPEKDVLAKANDLRSKLTAQNFASFAEKESQDPRTAKKGGDLGSFEKGHLDPRIETTAFQMKTGEISRPIKTEIGYILLYVEEHSQARTVDQKEAYPKIAKILISQANAPLALEAIKKSVLSGSAAETESTLKKYGLDWEKADAVSLGEARIPKISDSDDVLKILATNSGKTGLIHQLVGNADHQYVVDIVGWKKAEKPEGKEDLQRTLAAQASNDALQSWIRVAQSKATITRNTKLTER